MEDQLEKELEVEVELRNLPDFMSSLGYDEYTDPSLPGFLGDFKCTPEDFVVTEINSKGDLTVLDRFKVLPLAPPSDNSAESAPPYNNTTESAPPSSSTVEFAPPPSDSSTVSTPLSVELAPPPSGNSTVELTVLPSNSPAESAIIGKKRQLGSRPSIDNIPALEDLVSAEHYLACEDLSHTYKTTLEYDPDQQVDLGINADKGARGILHFAIRLTFPVLHSFSYKNEQGEFSMAVVADSKYKRLLEVLSPDEAEQVLRFVSTAGPDTTLALSPDGSRPHRTQVHRLLSELYGNYVISKYVSPKTPRLSGPPTPKAPRLSDPPTHTVPQLCDPPPRTPPHLESSIVLRVRKKFRKKAEVEGVSPSGDGSSGESFTKFVLWKRNLEMLEALQKLGEVLDVPPSMFHVSGNKDKKAITSQEVTVRGVSADRLTETRSCLDPEELDIGNFERAHQHIKLGTHSGNKFKVLLRSIQPKEGCDGVEGVVDSSLQSVRRCGFINYFGVQRFNRSLSMPRIGLSLLQNDIRAALDIALLESSALSPKVKDHIRQELYDLALQEIPFKFTRERIMLQKLHQYGHTDYACRRAFMSIPYSARTLYVHSLSSLMWNHAASSRLHQYGFTPVEGDLVLKDRRKGNMGGALSSREWIHVLSAEDVENKAYSMSDIVLPVLGTSIIYPHNKVADSLKGMLAALGLTIASFRVQSLRMHCPGAYRKLLAYPTNFTWKKITSLDIPPHKGPESPTTSISSATQQRLNLELEFDLNTSNYATMFIRELTKNVYM